jgi:hypothetical protein
MRPLRLVWVATLLLALVYMHGVSAESVMAHAAPGSVIPMDCPGQDESYGSHESSAETGSADADRHDAPDDHDPSHPAQECASGQPQQGPGLAAPLPLTTASGRASIAQPLPGAVLAGAEWAEPASRASTESTILRI